MIEQERMAVYIHSLDRELPEYLKETERKALEEHVPVIRPSTQSLLRFLIRSNRPVRILEVGAAVGFSSMLMSEYMEEGGHITTIEKVPKRIRAARETYERYGKTDCITLL